MKQLLIAPADKGRVTVVLDKTDYINKCEEHLSDSTTYTKVGHNPAQSLKIKINNTLKDLKQKQLFTEHGYKTLYSTTAATPLFYGLIKTHKENFPIRPIVSFVNSPSYNLAQHLSKVLTPITNLADQKLKNTYEAKEKFSNHSIPDNYALVSFDVQKLFTSIPHDLALNCLSIAVDEHEEKLFDTTRL